MRKRRILVTLCIFVIATALLSGCNQGSGDGIGDIKRPNYKFTLVVSSISGEFTETFRAGAQMAAARLGCRVEVVGPEREAVAEEAAMVEKALKKKVDGIAVSAGDSEGFREAQTLAGEKGIPFVTFAMDDGGNPPGAHPGYGTGYAGASEYTLGQIFAEKFFGDVAKDAETYMIATAGSDQPVCATRAQAIKDVAEKEGKELIATVDIGYDFKKANAIVKQALQKYPEVDAIVGTDRFSRAIADVVAGQKLGDQIWVGCFDPFSGTIKRLETGDCDLIVDQNPWLQAYSAVMSLYSLKADGFCAYDINTGALTWTQDQAKELKARYAKKDKED